MRHVLMIGGYDTQMEVLAALDAEVTLFQKNTMVSALQGKTVRRLYAFDYEDAEETVAVARALHARHPLHAVVSFTEYGLEPAALVREALGIEGNALSAVAATRDKVAMRARLASRGIASARYRECRSMAELEAFFAEVSGPIVVKPAKGTGSQGVASIDGRDELAGAWARASAVSLVPLIAEEYLDGLEVSVETMTVGGIHELLGVTQKWTTGKPGFVETAHQLPAELPAEQLAEVKRYVLEFLDAIGQTLGPAHTELRLTRDGPRIVESNTRPGGDFIWEMVHRALGVDLVKETLEALTTGSPPSREPGTGAAAVRFFAHESRTLEAVDGVAEAAAMPGVVRVWCTAKPGDILGPLRSSDDRQGYILATGRDSAEALARVNAAFAQVVFRFVA